MIVNYETEKIKNALYDFYNATGITIDILKPDFSPIIEHQYEFNSYCKCIQKTPKGKKACRMSDIDILKKAQLSKKMEMHTCHAGLIDVEVPIVYFDEILGYIIFGQMKTELSYNRLKDYMEALSLNPDTMAEHYNKIQFYDSEKIKAVSSIGSMLAKYLLLEKMLKPDPSDSLQKAVSYINEHLRDDLSIKSISKNAAVSKTVLYKRFHEHFGCTISEYVNKKRIEKSVDLLKTTDISIEEISQRVGFASTSYYSKIFKKVNGIPPLKFRKL